MEPVGITAGAAAGVVLRFYAESNDHLPARWKDRLIEKRPLVPASVKDLLESLGVPHTEVDLILVNWEFSDLARLVRNGDRVAVYPVFESIDITPLDRLRPEPCGSKSSCSTSLWANWRVISAHAGL